MWRCLTRRPPDRIPEDNRRPRRAAPLLNTIAFGVVVVKIGNLWDDASRVDDTLSLESGPGRRGGRSRGGAPYGGARFGVFSQVCETSKDLTCLPQSGLEMVPS